MNKWELFHAYRHLADAGKTKHLVCPDDNTKLVTRLGKDDEPVLWCVTENKYIIPGLDLLHQIQAVVNEHSEK